MLFQLAFFQPVSESKQDFGNRNAKHACRAPHERRTWRNTSPDCVNVAEWHAPSLLSDSNARVERSESESSEPTTYSDAPNLAASRQLENPCRSAARASRPRALRSPISPIPIRAAPKKKMVGYGALLLPAGAFAASIDDAITFVAVDNENRVEALTRRRGRVAANRRAIADDPTRGSVRGPGARPHPAPSRRLHHRVLLPPLRWLGPRRRGRAGLPQRRGLRAWCPFNRGRSSSGEAAGDYWSGGVLLPRRPLVT